MAATHNFLLSGNRFLGGMQKSLTLLFSFRLFAHPKTQQLPGMSLNFLFITSKEKKDNKHSFFSEYLTNTRQAFFLSAFVVVSISSFSPDRYWRMRTLSKNLNKQNPSIYTINFYVTRVFDRHLSNVINNILSWFYLDQDFLIDHVLKKVVCMIFYFNFFCTIHFTLNTIMRILFLSSVSYNSNNSYQIWQLNWQLTL